MRLIIRPLWPWRRIRLAIALGVELARDQSDSFSLVKDCPPLAMTFVQRERYTIRPPKLLLELLFVAVPPGGFEGSPLDTWGEGSLEIPGCIPFIRPRRIPIRHPYLVLGGSIPWFCYESTGAELILG